MIMVFLGTSCAGKSEAAYLVGRELNWNVIEGDTHHPPANKVKMKHHGALSEEERRRFTDDILDTVRYLSGKGDHVHSVISFSGLLKEQRRRLRETARVKLVFFRVKKETALARAAARKHHYFPPQRIESQFAVLEPPAAEEVDLIVDVDDKTPAEIVDLVRYHFGV